MTEKPKGTSLVAYKAPSVPALVGPLGDLEAFMHAAERAPILTPEEERSLAVRLRDDGDVEAAQRLILSHLRLVISIARGFLGYGLPYADLIQEGNIGLMKAIRHYDPDRGARLMTFAVHWIRSEIQEYIIRNWRIVKLATTKNQPKDVLEMEERLYGQETSLDTPSNADDDSDNAFTPSDWLTRESDEPEAILEEKEHQRLEGEGLQMALRSLDERSRRIITARYLNLDKEGNSKAVTLQELANEFGVSAERIRQIEKLAIQKMRQTLEQAHYSE